MFYCTTYSVLSGNYLVYYGVVKLSYNTIAMIMSSSTMSTFFTLYLFFT